jgi:hypothetical protein
MEKLCYHISLLHDLNLERSYVLTSRERERERERERAREKESVLIRK